MDVKNVKFRIVKSKVFQITIIILAFMITLPLIFIIYYIFKRGIGRINWTFLAHIPKPVGETGGGIVNALVGSILLVLVAAVIAIPFGILGGIYLSENRTSRLSYWSRLTVDVLQGVPSIVIGIVVYFWIVKTFGTFSALSGSVALAIMM
jgi:phosphate transport system permease protein